MATNTAATAALATSSYQANPNSPFQSLHTICSKRINVPEETLFVQYQRLKILFDQCTQEEKDALWLSYQYKIQSEYYYPKIFMAAMDGAAATADIALAQLFVSGRELLYKEMIEKNLKPDPDFNSRAECREMWISMVLLVAIAPTLKDEELIPHMTKIYQATAKEIKMISSVGGEPQHKPDEYNNSAMYLVEIGLPVIKELLSERCKNIALSEEMTSWMKPKNKPPLKLD